MADRERMHELIRDSPPWYKVPSLIKLYFLLIAPLLTSAAVGFDNSLTNGLQSIDAFMDEFGHPTGSRLGFFGASVSVGGIIGCIICGPLVEYFGRRPLCSSGAVLVVGIAIMQTWATNFEMFVSGKILIGLGVVLQQAAAPVLASELAHPKQRVSITAFYNTNIFIGLIIGGWATFGTYPIQSNWSWRLPCLLQIIIPSYQAVMMWFCPESPRWLISKGRVEEARQILIKWHGDGAETELVRLELQEIIAGIEADQTQIKLNWEGLKSVVSTKGNRHRLWICMWTAIGSQSIGGGYTASYLPLILDQIGMRTQSQKTLINALLNVWNWIVAFVAAMIIPKVGRRTVFLVSTLGTNITFIIWTALSAEYDKNPRLGFGIGVLVMIFSGSFFTCLCWIPLVIAYPIEAVTTKQRSIYFSITLLTINLTAFINSHLSPIGIGAIGWRYYLPCVFWNLLLLVIIYFTFVETTGMTLEEIATIFDGDEAFENAAAAVGEDLNMKNGEVVELAPTMSHKDKV
ncbi:hypothetical protein CDV36_005297 [Fusarium kuroshium]|uniref:Major facilitator superfamily (MFS) profile domain-containing protein n=1 Tax=Fusarium kuroshium TaxID=2010991 RepID=A0A3M2SBW2_9HYPO|nr:hypothetical protein CDV36_005297 [Fusarium kuroshium]